MPAGKDRGETFEKIPYYMAGGEGPRSHGPGPGNVRSASQTATGRHCPPRLGEEEF